MVYFFKFPPTLTSLCHPVHTQHLYTCTEHHPATPSSLLSTDSLIQLNMSQKESITLPSKRIPPAPFSVFPISMHACMLRPLSRVKPFVILWTVATRLLCPWDFSRQEYCGGFPCPPSGDRPNPCFSCTGRQVLYHLCHLRSPFLSQQMRPFIGLQVIQQGIT